jgi:hypothetical protein
VNFRIPDVTTSPPNTPKPRRRWLQFSLRTLMILVLVCAVPFGWLASRIDDARAERKSVAALSRIGAHVSYTSSPSLSTDSRFDSSTQQSTAACRVDEWLDIRLFDRVVALHAEGLGRGVSPGQTLDSPIARVADLRQVQLINLDHSLVTDGDLVHLRPLRCLRTLYLWGTNVGDAGIGNIADLAEIRILGLQRSLITDAGVERLRGLKNLVTLNLAETRVTDKCVPDLAGLRKLAQLDLSYTQVTDVGLVHLRGLTQLRELHLDGTQVSDAGLTHLQGLTQLQWLYFRCTQVTDAGVAELQKALQNCQIMR